MMNYDAITDLYCSIGRCFRSMGALNVYMMHSKVLSGGEYEMEMEIVLDTNLDMRPFQKAARENWPNVTMTIMSIWDKEDLVVEVKEDGIII